jgi:type VI secretion system secreted protein Hcp
MIFLARLSRVLFIPVFCLELVAPAAAANTIYMNITSSKQGPIKGEGKAPRAGEWMPLISVSETATSSRDAATGQGSGKRQHEPIKVVKEIGASSPQLQRALTSSELLKEVVIEFYRPNGIGTAELYETIRLTDAMITSIQNRGAVSAAKGSRPTEEISFAYEKIEITYTKGKTASDRLNKIN